MKKIGTYFFVFVISIIVFVLGSNYQTTKQPNTYFNVYLDDELIGMIESKEKLKKYINSQTENIKSNVKEYTSKLKTIDSIQDLLNHKSINSNLSLKTAQELLKNKEVYELNSTNIEDLNYYLNNKLYSYNSKEIFEMREYVKNNNIYLYANEVSTPNGIEIKKVYTYDNKLISVEDIYKKVITKKACTVAGYKFIIKSTIEGVEDTIIYTLDTNVFSEAIDKLITIFVDEEKYEAYKNNSQSKITTTGSVIENIYVQEEITYKAINISTEEKIYSNSNDLSAYLLYGNDYKERTVTVSSGDSIESISFNNQISVQEFLIFNKQYTSKDNLLVAGTDVVISTVDPKIQIVVENYEIVDKETDYLVVEQYDENLTQGSIVVSQEGINGIERVAQNVKTINGQISYIDPSNKETIKGSVPKIIKIGTKYVSTVGSTASWGWPTNSGYTITSGYGYRISPITGLRELHSGIDISGTGYGSNIYATNNGVIVERTYSSSYGNYIMIDHNNGFFTLYAHMSGFENSLSIGSTVSRGQVIGYLGSTGWATGPHLHYEIRTCEKYSCVTNPLYYY